MKKYILAAMLVLTLTAHGRTAADFFATAPEGVFPLLNRNTRLDMIDYYAGGLPTQSTNETGGRSRIVENEPERMLVQVSRDATTELAVVVNRNDTLLAVIETVHTPQPDSHIRFYTSDWDLCSVQPEPVKMADFITDTRAARNVDLPPMFFYKITYRPDSHSFIFTNTTDGYYATDDKPESLALLKREIEMTYSSRKFKPVKR